MEDFDGSGVSVVLGGFPCWVVVPHPSDVVPCATTDDLGVQHLLDFGVQHLLDCVFLVVVDNKCSGGRCLLSLDWVSRGWVQ